MIAKQITTILRDTPGLKAREIARKVSLAASLQQVTKSTINSVQMKKIKERLVFWTLAIYLVFFICLIP